MKTILAAVDFSGATNLVIAETVALARALPAKVLLVTVLVEPIFLPEYAPPSRGIAKITVSKDKSVHEHLTSIRQKLRAAGVSADFVVCRGSTSLNILKVAQKSKAAFIVIGARGHSALFELILGSTTQAVLKDAQQPVLIIPAKMKAPRNKKARKSPAKVKA